MALSVSLGDLGAGSAQTFLTVLLPTMVEMELLLRMEMVEQLARAEMEHYGGSRQGEAVLVASLTPAMLVRCVSSLNRWEDRSPGFCPWLSWA
jgi:hypothetical protein